jgi:hypothetical protein
MVAASPGIVFFQKMECNANDFCGQKEKRKQKFKSQKTRQEKVDAGFKVL